MTLVCKSHGIGNDLFTLFMSGGWIAPGINPKCRLMHWPCPDDSKKKRHLYVSLMVLEIVYFTLFMRELNLNVVRCIGLVLTIQDRYTFHLRPKNPLINLSLSLSLSLSGFKNLTD